MRRIPDEQIKPIQEPANELRDLMDKAACRLIPYIA